MAQSKVEHDLSVLISAIEADPENRCDMHPRLLDLISRMEANGLRVPARVRELERALCDEEADQMFDNLPI